MSSALIKGKGATKRLTLAMFKKPWKRGLAQQPRRKNCATSYRKPFCYSFEGRGIDTCYVLTASKGEDGLVNILMYTLVPGKGGIAWRQLNVDCPVDYHNDDVMLQRMRNYVLQNKGKGYKRNYSFYFPNLKEIARGGPGCWLLKTSGGFEDSGKFRCLSK